jgi:hypothetical protein
MPFPTANLLLTIAQEIAKTDAAVVFAVAVLKGRKERLFKRQQRLKR